MAVVKGRSKPGSQTVNQRGGNINGVFIIDDHPLMRAGMAKVINQDSDLEVCGELGCGKGAVDIILKSRPDVILLDLSLKDSNGLELIKDFRASDIDCPILVISTHDETLYANRVLRAGANGYIMKDEATSRLIEGLHTVLDDNIFLSEAMNRIVLKQLTSRTDNQGKSSLGSLTDRELEVYELLGQGLGSRAIADNLGISSKTVDAHRANIKKKLGLSDGMELVRHAVRWVEND